MTADQRLIVVGIYINSALYLVAVVALGFLTGHRIAYLGGTATFGICYLSYVVQIAAPAGRSIVWNGLAISLFGASIVCGATAGLSLFW